MKMKLAGTLLTAILATAAALAAAPLVDNGRSDYRIVVPADAIPAERTAAEELQTFLAEIGGVNCRSSPKPTGRPSTSANRRTPPGRSALPTGRS